MKDECTNCGNTPTVAKGLCATCYGRQRRGKPLTDPPRTSPGEGDQITIRCSKDQLTAWERAAKKAKQAFRDWIRSTLDTEANRQERNERSRADFLNRSKRGDD